MHRRDYLRTIGAASATGGLIGIAGCAGPGDDGVGEGDSEEGGGGEEAGTAEDGGEEGDTANITEDIAEYNNSNGNGSGNQSGGNRTGQDNESGITDDDNESEGV